MTGLAGVSMAPRKRLVHPQCWLRADAVNGPGHGGRGRPGDPACPKERRRNQGSVARDTLGPGRAFMAAPCLLLPGDGNAFLHGGRGTLHVQWTSRLHRCRRTDRLMDKSRSTVQPRNRRHPLRSESPRRPAVVVGAPAVGLRAAAAICSSARTLGLFPAGVLRWMIRDCRSAVPEPCYCCLGSLLCGPRCGVPARWRCMAVFASKAAGLPGRVTGCAGDGLGSAAPPVGKLGIFL